MRKLLLWSRCSRLLADPIAVLLAAREGDRSALDGADLPFIACGDAARAAEHFEHERRLLRELGIPDVDLFPAPELVESYLRLRRENDARLVAAQFATAAEANGQPWSMARAALPGLSRSWLESSCVERSRHSSGLTPRLGPSGPAPNWRPAASACSGETQTRSTS